MGGHRRQRRGLDPRAQGFPGKSNSPLLERPLDHLGWQRHLGIHQVQLDEFVAHGFRPAFGQRGEIDQQWTRVARRVWGGGGAEAAGAGGLLTLNSRGGRGAVLSMEVSNGIEAAAGGGGVGAKVIPPRGGSVTGCGAGGATWRGAGAGADSGLAGPTEKISPWLRGSKGLEISTGTSTCFCTRRRVIKAGLSRDRISPSGSGTNTLSRSASSVKRSGAACRSSPKGTFTTPRESCARIFSSGMEMVSAPASGCLSRGCSSRGRLPRMGCRGSSIPRPF